MEESRGDIASGISSSGSVDIVRACNEKEGGFCVAGGDEATRMVAMAHNTGSAPSVHYQQQPQYVAPPAPRRWHQRAVQKLERWIFLYNVTTGLYMLDGWERCIFNAVFLVFFAIAGYNSGHYLQRIGAGLLAWAWWGDSASAPQGFLGDGAGG